MTLGDKIRALKRKTPKTYADMQWDFAIDRAAALADEHKASSRPMCWRPISSAPKDRHILLWLGSPYDKLEKAIWYEPWSRWVDELPTASDLAGEQYGIGSAVPTHWADIASPALADEHQAEADALVAAAKGALMQTAASLAAAISLLERGGKAAKKAAPSNTMFDIMLNDYRASLENARATLAKIGGQ